MTETSSSKPCIGAGLSIPRQRVNPRRKDTIVLGQRIHYLEAGHGEPIVLLHGMGGEGARWAPNIQTLAQSFSVYSPDLIGFGNSDKPLTTYHIGVFAGFIAGFMKNLGLQQATLIGQSMGARVALYLAIHNPELVTRLVLVNCDSFRDNTDPPQGQPNWHARQIANAGTLAESRQYLEKIIYNHGLITDDLVEENLILRLRSAYTIESTFTAEARGLGAITKSDLQNVSAPTLLFWGIADPIAPPVHADRLCQSIKNCQKILVERAGHFPFLEHPHEFNEAVSRFMKG